MEYAGPLIVLDLIMVKKFIGVPPEVIMRSGGYIPGARDITGLLVRPDWKVPSLHHFTWNSPFQLVRALPTAAPSSRQITLCVISALFLYDFLFYIPHIAMHKVSICAAKLITGQNSLATTCSSPLTRRDTSSDNQSVGPISDYRLTID